MISRHRWQKARPGGRAGGGYDRNTITSVGDDMNRKLVLGAVAGVAAIGLAVGGTTYAAYSDFGDVGGNDVGAGTLMLDLHGNQAGDVKFDHITMAPGGIATQRQVFIASNDGTSTPSAVLSVSLTDLVGTEDGCDGSQEAIDDGGACNTPGSGPTSGQFLDDATVQWYSYIPTTAGVCNESYTTATTDVTPQYGGSLAHLASTTDPALGGTPYSLMSHDTLPVATAPVGRVIVPWLAPGQGMCFAMSVGLAYGVDNASQGDSASFNLHFDLNQAPAGTPTTPYTGTGAVDSTLYPWWY
jgi:hypothetical protein